MTKNKRVESGALNNNKPGKGKARDRKSQSLTNKKLMGKSDLENKDMFYQNSIKGLEVLNSPPEQLQSHLRTKVTRQLVTGFALPEIIDGLVEYLTEIVREDPLQAKLFGVVK